MTSQRHLVLGLFFLVAAAILGYFTLFLADVSFFGEKVRMKAYFSETNGLREGDAVLVAGMRWGKVDSLTFRPQSEFSERIEVAFSLTEPVVLKEDVVVTIEDATLLGGKILSIEPGSAGSPPRVVDAKLLGRVSGNVLEEVQKVVVENRAAIKGAVDGLEAVVAELQGTQGVVGRLINDPELGGQVDSAIRNIADTFQNLNDVTEKVAKGEGSIGRLLMQEEVYASLERASQNLDSLIAEARDALKSAQDPNAGAIGLLWNDPGVAKDLAGTIANLNTISQGLVDGQGTLGFFLTDDRLAKNLTTISQRLADGQGSLGRFLTEDQPYEDLSATLANLRHASGQLVSTEGTIGLLLNDDELYADLQKAVGTLTGTLEEAREAAPISTFLSTVFLGF